MEKDFHIAIAFEEPIIEPSVVAGFEDDIQAPNLMVRVEGVPMGGVRAALEWLMPTAVAAYLAKPYFESFLSEMGKDHYAVAKKAFGNLRERVSAKYGSRIRVFAGKGKLGADAAKFSPVFSVYAEAPTGFRVKLLVQIEITPGQFDNALDAFLHFMSEMYGLEELTEASQSLLEKGPVGSMLLVCFNTETARLEYVNPIPEHIRPKQ